MGNANKYELIRDDLSHQLKSIGKFGKHYEDLIDDYVDYAKLKDKLKRDIKKNGLRMEVSTGNGHMATKPNESIPNQIKVQMQMLKILSDLGMHQPSIEKEDSDDYLPRNK